jgi:DNA repair exonuclease SbcCD ATPase subunit
MKILRCVAENFASYENLEFNFVDQGLTLIQGATGAGKSTLCDVIPWTLFGKTAKNGAADEVLSFPGDKVTRAVVVVQAKQEITVVRIRGNKNNDLYFNITNGDENIRGKDLNDTQKLINDTLGINSDLYLSGAYYHEFSQTAQFFTTNAKNRRIICEQIVDLQLASKLKVKISEEKKKSLLHLETVQSEIAELKSNISYMISDKVRTQRAIDERFASHRLKVKKLKEKSDSFDNDRIYKVRQLEDLIKDLNSIILEPSHFDNKRSDMEQTARACETCGNIKKTDMYKSLEKELQQEETTNRELINKLHYTEYELNCLKENSINTYKEQLEELNNELDPNLKRVFDLDIEIGNAKSNKARGEDIQKSLESRINDLSLLLEVIEQFRSLLIGNTLTYIESNTNKLLNDYFDAEIRVAFSATDADKIDIDITKDGNVCSYTQLSKGQRQILKLCFGVSVMRTVANNAGVQFHQLFFDEALDGLDDNMKIKAFTLINSLNIDYKSIFVVEHNEALKTLFTNKFTVELVNGSSKIV